MILAIQKKPPFGPLVPLEISPEDYERQVSDWLKHAGESLEEFEIYHQKKQLGSSGEYSLDGLAHFQIFQGARISVVIECKKHKRPVERDVVLTLHSKLRDIGAHKAMIFSTAGFQRGALEYASEHGIATIVFVDGKLTYMTKSAETPPGSIWPLDLPLYAGFILSITENKTNALTIDDNHLDPLAHWLRSEIHP